MFSKVNIGDWIMCTKTFLNQRSANKWYQRILGDIDIYFYYKADNGSGLASSHAYNEFDLENILTNKEYLKMVRKPTFEDVNLGDWIRCTKTLSNQRTVNQWYQRILSRDNELTNEFYYKPDDGTSRSATNKCSDFDLTKILTNDEYEAMIKNDKPKTLTPDVVNNPSHYTSGAIECIDAIRAALGKEGFISHCVGTCIKYLFRHNHKGNSLQDLKKAQWYLNKLISELEK